MPEEEIKVGEVIIPEKEIASNHSSEEETRALKQAREEEVRRKIKEMILSRLSEEELAKVLDEHKRLSAGIGYSVGIHAEHEETRERKPCIVDEVEALRDQGVEGKVKSTNKDFLLSFLRVRDIDNNCAL